ncbi:MAG: alpha-L-fucosidase [Porphyromonadaceae bacterium]|nr:MAG: alpha-L-fucosidase [Porphyromonadaceae bacterium]
MKKLLLTIILPLGLLMLTTVSAAQKAKPDALQSWRDVRFGMFIHWGPVSLTEKEISWSRANTNPKCPNNGPTAADVYDNLYKQFNPLKFNAKEWVATAMASGMKYMVFTAKHCDGFLMWDSKVDEYNIMHTPFRRDVCAELAKAAHDAGMKIGWYFSPMDWRDPDCRNEKNAEFVKRMQAELIELLTNYGKIDILWFDTDGKSAPWDQETTYKLVRKLQPDIVINERLDLGDQGGWNEGVIGPRADFHTPEQTVGNFDQRPWESCMTLSKHDQWSWGGHADGVKSAGQCLEMLIRCAGGDGNMLLDVGPMPTGEIAPEQVSVINEIGLWLAKYGRSIYGTRGGPWKPDKSGVSTYRGNTIYLHILNQPGDTLELPAIPAKIVRATALSGGKVSVTQTEKNISITLPHAGPEMKDLIIALELDSPASGIEPLKMSFPSLSWSTGKKAHASNIYKGLADYAAGKACDDDELTRWATDNGIQTAWLEVDLGSPKLVGRALIKQAYPELRRIRKFSIEYWQDNQWKPCYNGENLGEILDISFNPVTAQRVRLNITEATEGPTIREFQIFSPVK